MPSQNGLRITEIDGISVNHNLVQYYSTKHYTLLAGQGQDLYCKQTYFFDSFFSETLQIHKNQGTQPDDGGGRQGTEGECPCFIHSWELLCGFMAAAPAHLSDDPLRFRCHFAVIYMVEPRRIFPCGSFFQHKICFLKDGAACVFDVVDPSLASLDHANLS